VQVLSTIDTDDPVGDCDEDTRFAFGANLRWSVPVQSSSPSPSDRESLCSVGNSAESLEEDFNLLLKEALLAGYPLIERCNKGMKGQTICRVAQAEGCSMIVMPCLTALQDKPVVIEVVREAMVSVVLVK
jgi:hypothetical protein